MHVLRSLTSGPKPIRAYNLAFVNLDYKIGRRASARGIGQPWHAENCVWLPTSEDEIKAAIENRVVRESSTFDAKAAPPAKGKNKDLARDICAITVDGGVLLY